MNGQDLVDAAWSQRTYPQDWEQHARRHAGAYYPRATGQLSTLRVASDELQSDVLAFQSRIPVPRELLEVAAFGMHSYITPATAHRLPALLAAARTEYARAELQQAISIPAMLRLEGNEGGHDVAVYRADCRTRGWEDADVIAAHPLQLLDSPSESIVYWLGCTDLLKTDRSAHLFRSPCKDLDEPPEELVLEAALVLSWLDTAICQLENSLALIGHAMELFGYIRWQHGWDANQLLTRDDRHLSAKNAANARHQLAREWKQRAVALYLAGNYPSKDAAAFAMAGREVPLSFRTIRDALKGV